MKILTRHNHPSNIALMIMTIDEAPSGGVNYWYRIRGFDYLENPSVSDLWEKSGDEVDRIDIIFQNGDPAVVGANGITMEALLAIVANRLEEFQSGPTACVENGVALDHTLKALASLHARTTDRARRGVVGKQEV